MLEIAIAQVSADLPFREVYWNVSHPNLFVYPPLAIAMAVFLYGVWRRFSIWKQGQKNDRLDALVGRGLKAGWIAGSQAYVLREPGPGLLHAALFFGFVVLFIGTCIVMVEKYLGFKVLSTPSYFYWGYTVTLNIFGLLAIIGILFLAVRRYVLRPVHLDNRADDWISIVLILVILITGHLIQAFRLADLKPWWAPWSFVSFGLAKLFWNAGSETLRTCHLVFWWIHLLTMLAWLAYLPFSKMWHMVAGALGLMFRSTHSRGRIKKDPDVAAMLAEEEIDEDCSFGVSRLEDFTWKNLLDADACIRCGRCQANCPANLTGKLLNPKQLVQDVKSHMEEVYTLPKNIDAEEDGRTSLHIDVIKPEVLWACTTCRACESNCPMGIEHLEHIIPMRQYLTQMETAFPQEVTNVFKGMENNSNPWQIGSNKRFDWAEVLGLKPMSEDAECDYLYFVGCMGSFDDRAIKVTKAFVAIMQAAGIKVGFLGNEEACCGETARRIGNEYLAQAMMMQNVELFKGYNVRRIVTACPHCYNTIKNEYPDFGGDFEVFHHTELIAEALRSNKLTLSGNGLGKVAFHDSCYLGRYNEIYSPPRDILRSVPKLTLTEADRNQRKSFCCGAGGGRMWMEEHEGTRVNIERTQQLAATGADTFACACPYCLTMIFDGIKDQELDETHKILDVAEIVQKHLA